MLLLGAAPTAWEEVTGCVSFTSTLVTPACLLLPQVKLVLAGAMWSQPHLLVLDEPTNYLDRESLGALASAITEFGGGVIMIRCGPLLLAAFPVCVIAMVCAFG